MDKHLFASLQLWVFVAYRAREAVAQNTYHPAGIVQHAICLVSGEVTASRPHKAHGLGPAACLLLLHARRPTCHQVVIQELTKEIESFRRTRPESCWFQEVCEVGDAMNMMPGIARSVGYLLDMHSPRY